MQVNISRESDVCELKSKIYSLEIVVDKQDQEILYLRKQLEESNKENSELYDYNTTIYFTIDTNFFIQSLNFQAAQFLGIERQYLINTLFLNFVTLYSASDFQNTMQQIITQKFRKSCEIELLKKGGDRKLVIVEGTLLKNDLIRLSIKDITLIRQLKVEIFDTKKALDLVGNLFHHVNEAIAVIDSNLNIKLLNQAFTDFFSRTFAIRIEKYMNISMILCDFPELKSEILNSFEQALVGEPTSVILENHHDDIEVYYCYEVVIASLFNHYSKKKDLTLRIINLTEYKLEERRKYKQQADIALSGRLIVMGEMAFVLAHEINQPLTAIIAYGYSCLHFLEKQSDNKLLRDRLLLPLEKILTQARHAGEVIHNMKKLTQENTIQMEYVDINILIKESLTILHYELLGLKIKISLKFMADLPKIKVNKIHIIQVILNLARNSLEALQSSATKKPELIVQTSIREESILVDVIDNGPGIPSEYRDKILRSYFTTKPQGTGIGLGICRTLLEAHGGKLSLQTHSTRGAWFTFNLPITKHENA